MERLQRTVTDHLNIISDNPKYPIQTLPPEYFETLKIFGKVKGAVMVKDF